MHDDTPTAMLTALRDAVIQGDAKGAAAATARALGAGVAPQRLVDEALIPAMDEAGSRFENGEFFVPELLVAARALKASQALVTPLLAGTAVATRGRVAIGTVKGDLHDIGKNLVAMMWKGANVNVVDIGINVRPPKFVEAVRQHGAHAVGLSCLLTTTMPAMKATVEALRAADLGGVKIVVGGAPVTEAFARDIGADAHGRDAAEATEALLRVLGA